MWRRYTVEPLLWGHPFCARNVAFQEGWPLVRGRNQYIYVSIYIVQWPFQRGWPLVRVASKKGFNCKLIMFRTIPVFLINYFLVLIIMIHMDWYFSGQIENCKVKTECSIITSLFLHNTYVWTYMYIILNFFFSFSELVSYMKKYIVLIRYTCIHTMYCICHVYIDLTIPLCIDTV